MLVLGIVAGEALLFHGAPGETPAGSKESPAKSGTRYLFGAAWMALDLYSLRQREDVSGGGSFDPTYAASCSRTAAGPPI